MYSPKISEELVPVLYRLAKAQRIPMTRLVDRLIRQGLIATGNETPAVNKAVQVLPEPRRNTIRPDYTYRRAA